ncbi:hypothetical protein FKW77_008607 [Venturia effusa]|uniref:Secreted protein n=1 Tax=Venturia effusa TaxID=50376 RepID=A0A517KX12_9PEZI|nr:hypothetical protein FKW77_008607 [Venturia effusa]
MYMIPYFLITLLTLAPAPASANSCENYRTTWKAVCPDHVCENVELLTIGDRFQEAKDAFMTWVKDNSPHCAKAAECDRPEKEWLSLYRYTWAMNCYASRVWKKHKTGIPAPPAGLERMEDQGACDDSCSPHHGWPSYQICGFKWGDAKEAWDVC